MPKRLPLVTVAMIDALHEACASMGGKTLLAKKLGLAKTAIYKWTCAPASHVLPIERLTGVSRHRLRPDLYPEGLR